MHVCQNLKILGVDTNGAFAEYLAVPEIVVWKNDPNVPPEYMSIQEPLGNAVHATLIEPVHGKSVAILGDGPVGLFSAGVARASGATQIFMTGIEPFRLAIGKQMGVDRIINVAKEDAIAISRKKRAALARMWCSKCPAWRAR